MNHSWNGPLPELGARYAIPEPSGAHVGWATSWSVITARRGPMVEPLHGASTRYDTCFWYVQIIAIWLPSGEIDGWAQSSSVEVNGWPSAPSVVKVSPFAGRLGRVAIQSWPTRLPLGSRLYFVYRSPPDRSGMGCMSPPV